MSSARRTWIVCCLVIGVAGCSKIMGPKASAPLPAYPDGPAGLQAMFTDVLAAAKDDDRARVHDIFQSLKLTRPELDQLFGAAPARELAHGYDEMMATLIHRGAVELVGMVYEKKYDTVEVIDNPLGLPPGTEGPLRAEDAALSAAMVQHPHLYAVRLRKQREALGTRYDFFFFQDGHWRTGNQLGKLLAKRQAELTAPPPPR